MQNVNAANDGWRTVLSRPDLGRWALWQQTASQEREWRFWRKIRVFRGADCPAIEQWAGAGLRDRPEEHGEDALVTGRHGNERY